MYNMFRGIHAISCGMRSRETKQQGRGRNVGVGDERMADQRSKERGPRLLGEGEGENGDNGSGSRRGAKGTAVVVTRRDETTGWASFV